MEILLNCTFPGIKIIDVVKLYPKGYIIDATRLFYTLSGIDYLFGKFARVE